MSLPNQTLDQLAAALKEAGAKPVAPTDLQRPKHEKLVWVKPHQCSVWRGNTRDVSSINAPRFDALRASIMAKGQQVPVLGRRIGDTNTIEVIAGACRLTVLQEEARNNPDVLIMVELREMDDAEACALVAAENEGRRAFVPLETAHFYKQALTTKIYKDQAALADALSLNKSNVGRTLTILDLPTKLLDLVTDPRAISARQASTFMTYWNDAAAKPVMQACLASLQPANAARTFKAVFDAVQPPTSDNDLQTIEGAVIGTLRSTRAGVKIELGTAADAVELEVIVASIRQRILELRTRD